MKLISFLRNGAPSYGAADGDRVADFGAIAGPDEHDLVAALKLGAIPALAAEAPFDVPLNQVELLPVVTNPGKIFCVGHNYETHRQETGRAKVGHPSIFTRFADTLTPHDGPIIRPRVSTSLDYEGELAIVIGKGGRHIAEADAMDHVAGFACANDASVRDWQWHTQQFTPGKNFPSTGGLGPVAGDPGRDHRPGGRHRDDAPERPGDAACRPGRPDLPAADHHRLSVGLHPAVAGRSDPDRHAGRRRRQARAAGVDEGRRRR
jgi:2-keto-4-pentenoate hydratase/2-oxohepta-3-ene-1,7-dioic acid hydratase in catechol pathway